ncbi:MAG TPA: PKD domain-containing protein [Saprospiraceae bacterium]|nr:PKD domain-containing protein [Saprospiraceae bacterium]
MGKGSLYLTLILCSFSFLSLAQKEDNTWIFGYNTEIPGPLWGGIKLTFEGDSIHILHQDILRNFTLFDASISDKDGNLLFYSDGSFIMNKNHQFMENGDSINFLPYKVDNPIGVDTQGNGYGTLQGGIILPQPGNDSIYIMYHCLQSELYVDFYSVLSLLKTTVNIKANNGLGKVISKNISFKDLKYLGFHMNAVRHANGRDWWIINKRDAKPEFFLFLQTPKNLIELPMQTIGEPDIDGYGQHYFSPDGSMYAYSNIGPKKTEIRIHLLDFDRCTGTLSNERFFSIKDTISGIGGMCFSPDSRFLYFNSQVKLYQADLKTSDIKNSIKLIDIFDLNAYQAFDTLLANFFMMNNAPDGKIYMNSISSSRWLHEFNHPEREGKACDFRKFAITMPHYNLSLPNFPNFRLGPIDGSACDTLGIDNIPVANFNYERAVAFPSHFDFTDLSYYDPQVWKWDFGDGSTSTERYPVHDYKITGDYEVCLTVSNPNGIDTKCKYLYSLYTATKEPLPDEKIATIYPNPVAHMLMLELLSPLKEASYFYIYDALGHVVYFKILWGAGPYYDFNLDGIAPGMYYYNITSQDKIIQTGKVAKL